MVASRAHRLGLPAHSKAVQISFPLPKKLPRPPISTLVNADNVTRRTVLTIRDNECRWPIGDPQMADFHFCGKNKVQGLPYCEAHIKTAYNVLPPKRQVAPIMMKVLEKV